MNKIVYNSGVLGYEEILNRLKKGEIFKPDTWTEDNLRAAGYDLRVADDFLIVSERDDSRSRKYKKGEKRKGLIILDPGQVAFLSTQEKLCIPWDIAANIGIKFGYARKGVLVLTGLLVDPGYGLMLDNNGSWVPNPDERIHFLVANVGSNRIPINPGKDKIASLQFFKVIGKVKKIYIPSGENMEDEFFQEEKETGLIFFKNVTSALRKVGDLDNKMNIMERGTKLIIFFGVYLLGISIMTVFLSNILHMISSDLLLQKINKIISVMPDKWPQVASLLIILFVSLSIIVVVLVGTGYFLYKIPWFFWRIYGLVNKIIFCIRNKIRKIK